VAQTVANAATRESHHQEVLSRHQRVPARIRWLHKPTIFVAEKDKGYESLDLAIRKLAILRNVPLPYMRWVNTSSGSKTPLQKAKRIKKLEIPLASDQLWFCSGGWDVDAVFGQFTKMDGGIFVSSNSHRSWMHRMRSH
jgi:hypothetical protein